MDFDFCVNRVDTKNASAIAYASKSTAKLYSMNLRLRRFFGFSHGL